MIELTRAATRLRRWTAIMAFVFVGLSAVGAQAAENSADHDEFSEANRLLFMTDHLANVQTPAQLHYSFRRDSTEDEDSYQDKVDLAVADGNGNGKQVDVDFFTGDRHRYTPDIGNAHGNPVIMMFLQNDVAAIAERTGGSWRYFQRRMKFALADEATVKADTATYDGREVDVKRIQLTPFTRERSHRDAMAGEIHKQYVFTLSDAVPGGVLEIRSEVPGAGHRPPSVSRWNPWIMPPGNERDARSALSRWAAIVLLAMAPALHASDGDSQTLLVLPFDMVDSSLQGDLNHGPLEADVARLRRTEAIVRRALDERAEFDVIDRSGVANAIEDARSTYRYLYACNGCEIDLGASAGVDLVLTGWVQKVSNLIINVNATIYDVESGDEVGGGSVDMRSNTDRAWRSAALYLIENPLMTNYHARRHAARTSAP